VPFGRGLRRAKSIKLRVPDDLYADLSDEAEDRGGDAKRLIGACISWHIESMVSETDDLTREMLLPDLMRKMRSPFPQDVWEDMIPSVPCLKLIRPSED
jgi:hypothetical protein